MKTELIRQKTRTADGLLIHRLWVRFPPLSLKQPLTQTEENPPSGGRRSAARLTAASAAPVPRTFSELKQYRFRLWKQLQAFPIGTAESAALRAELSRTGLIAHAFLRGDA